MTHETKPPETAFDLCDTVLNVGGPRHPASLRKLADRLFAAGVTRQDLQAAFSVLIGIDGHGEQRAKQLMGVVMLDMTVRDLARRRGGAPSSTPTRGERERGTRTNTAHKMRMDEMQAEGIGREEALRYEQGGYIHEGIVGDTKDPQDLGRDHGLDPWDVVQLASAWAQRFNGGTDGLRRALAATVASCRACAKTMKGEAANDMLNKAERFARYLEGVAVKQPAQEATT